MKKAESQCTPSNFTSPFVITLDNWMGQSDRFFFVQIVWAIRNHSCTHDVHKPKCSRGNLFRESNRRCKNTKGKFYTYAWLIARYRVIRFFWSLSYAWLIVWILYHVFYCLVSSLSLPLSLPYIFDYGYSNKL